MCIITLLKHGGSNESVLLPFLRFHPVCCTRTIPVISFDKTHHDFGTISDFQKVTHRYRLTNSGKATLLIKEIRPSCGCSHTVVGKMALQPGENTYIEVHFDPTGITGSTHKYLEVIFLNQNCAFQF